MERDGIVPASARSNATIGRRSGRARLNIGIDRAALAAAAAVFATGLVLLLGFHVGPASVRAEGLGLSRLAWVDAHRLSAVATLLTVGAHLALHRRVIAARLSRALGRIAGAASRADRVLYASFVVATITGFAAWLVLPGSPPFFGPVRWTTLPPLRHLSIDLHNVSAIALLVASVIHVRRHVRAILPRPQPGRRSTTTVTSSSKRCAGILASSASTTSRALPFPSGSARATSPKSPATPSAPNMVSPTCTSLSPSV
jgi:hypothetical protein